jgi:ribosomal protein S18 acetylase RimI-like enzyme
MEMETTEDGAQHPPLTNAGMDPRITEVERAALSAWPAAHVQELDGWKLRFHWNMTGRANSVWPNEVTGSRSLEQRLDQVAHFYHGWLLPARYQVSPASCPPELDEVLDARGYRFQQGASVQIQSIDALLSRAYADAGDALRAGDRVVPLADRAGGSDCLPTPADRISNDRLSAHPGDGGIPELTIQVLTRPDDAWFSVQKAALALEPKWASLRRSLIQEIAVRSANDASAGFALCRANGEPAAIAIGVLTGNWLGIFGMATAPRFRRCGAAIRSLRGLADWAEGRVSTVYLQVFQENRPALALYEKLGFEELYAYHYRVEPWPS